MKRRAVYLLSIVLTGFTAAQAQPTLQGAHDLGIGFATQQKDEVGTSRINEQTAAQVPLYKPNPLQQNSYDGGFGDMLNIGVGRITESQAYTPGNCDKEGFDPEQAAKSVVGPQKWAAMSPEQRSRAISDQVSYFDQECEGINFLAGDYKMREKIEISPGDDLNDWNPGGETDGNGQCSMQTITVPPEYEENSCYQTTALEKRQCFDEANVNVYFETGLTEEDVHVVLNAKTPTWDLTFHPKDLTIHVIGTGYRFCIFDILPGCVPGGGTIQWTTIDLGTISMYGGRSAVVPYGSETHNIESDHYSDGCVFRINSRHVAGGAGPGDVHGYWIINLCVPTKHVDVNWIDNCALLEAATKLQ